MKMPPEVIEELGTPGRSWVPGFPAIAGDPDP